MFKLHRCVLSIRSPGFNKLLGGKWKDVVDVKNNLIEPKIFEEFVKYLYTGKLKCSRDQYMDMKQLANRCGMKTMINLLDAAYVTTTTFGKFKYFHNNLILKYYKRVLTLPTLSESVSYGNKNDEERSITPLLNDHTLLKFINECKAVINID